MSGRIVLLSLLALAGLLGFGLYSYICRCFVIYRRLRWLARGLFSGLMLALLVSAVIIAFNPAVSYGTREQLLPYVYTFYAGVGVALGTLVALVAIAGVSAMQRGNLRKLLRQSVEFAQRFAGALTQASGVWLSSRSVRGNVKIQTTKSSCWRELKSPHDGQPPEQGTCYDPLEKWMNPNHPAHPVLYELLDE